MNERITRKDPRLDHRDREGHTVTATVTHPDVTNTEDTKVKELDVVKRTKERAAGARMALALRKL